MNIKTILQEIQDKTGWDQAELGEKLGVTQASVSRWYKGSTPKSQHEKGINRLAQKLQIIKDTSITRYSIPVVGYIGAGGGVIYAEGQGPFGEAKMPPKGVSPSMVAVEVRGDSMAPLIDEGATIYYDNRSEPPTDALFGRLCVVGLTDGRILIKRLLPGRKPGLFDLYSLAAVPLVD